MSDNFLYQGKRSFWKSLLFFMAAFSPFILWHFFRITDTQAYKWPFLLIFIIHPLIFALSRHFTIEEHQSADLYPTNTNTAIQHDKIQKIEHQKIHFITNWYFISIYQPNN